MRVQLADPDLLARTMQDRGLSNRGLSRAAGVGHGVVAALVSGSRSSVQSLTADLLEEALGVARGGLFVRSVSKPLAQIVTTSN